jgi:hypothetical protein
VVDAELGASWNISGTAVTMADLVDKVLAEIECLRPDRLRGIVAKWLNGGGGSRAGLGGIRFASSPLE